MLPQAVSIHRGLLLSFSADLNIANLVNRAYH